jgi:outer membrane protein assembly factor BamB
MPHAGDVGALRCAGCGAPFESSGGSRCAFCGNLLRRSTTIQSTVVPPPPPPRIGSTIRRLVMFYVAFGVVGVAIAGISSLRANRRLTTTWTAPFSRRPGGSSPADDHGIRRALQAVPRAGGGYDLLTTLYNQSYALGLFDGQTHDLRWRAGAFAREANRNTIVVDAQNAYVVDDPSVTAIRLKDGATLWQASLATGFPSSCDGCLRAAKDRVLVLQKDGTLQAFDVASGQVAWSVKLANTPSRLSIAGPWLVVDRPPEGRDNRVTLDFLDPADGKVVHSVQPSCINKAFHRPEHVNNRTPLFFDPEGHTVYALFGFFSHCAQAWDVETGKRRWSTYLSSWDWNTSTFLGEHALWFAEGGRAIVSIDRETGAVRKLAIDAELRAYPLLTTGDTLIAKAAPDWDSSRVAIWGMDPTSGKRRWQFQLSAHNVSLSDIFDSWFARATAAGLIVFQRIDDQHLSVDTLNVTTGVSAGRRLLPADGRNGPAPLLQDDAGWINVPGGLDAVSLPGGQVAYHLR